MGTKRIGIVGVGGMGSFHAGTLARLAGVEVASVSDPHQPSARRIRDELGARVVDDPFDLIADATLDGVVVASPDDTHVELALAAVERGVPLLCEKPLATTAPDALRVIDAECATGRRTIQLGFMREYDPAHRQVHNQLGELGAVDHIRALHRNANDRRRPLAEIVGQSIVHDVHTVRYLSGADVTSVTTSGSAPSNDSFRHLLVICRLSTGAHALIEFDDGGFAYEVTVEVLTASGDVLSGPPTRAVRRHRGSIDTHLGSDWFGWFADAYRLQDEAWVDSITAGTPTGPTAWDGYAAQLTVDAILESLTTGASVAVPTPPRPDLYSVR